MDGRVPRSECSNMLGDSEVVSVDGEEMFKTTEDKNCLKIQISKDFSRVNF